MYSIFREATVSPRYLQVLERGCLFSSLLFQLWSFAQPRGHHLSSVGYRLPDLSEIF